VVLDAVEVGGGGLDDGLAESSRTLRLEDVADRSPASPLVMSVNSHVIPSWSYDSCKGRQGLV
jgi:hypothetical protein